MLVHAFDKLPAFKTRKKKATSPKFSRLMPKASEIVLENEKRTDICINPVISIMVGSERLELSQDESY